MTTSELLRRLNFYSSLDDCVHYFNEPDSSFIFRIVFVKEDNSRIVKFTMSYFIDLPDSLVTASIERFTNIDFVEQVNNFISFYRRCSTSQKDYVCKSNLVNNLLSFVK